MSQFEYLNKISLGQYLPIHSVIHRLNPGVKLAGFIIFILAITLTTHLYGLLVAAGLIFLLFILSKIPIGFAIRGLLPPLPFILIMAIIQLFIISYQSKQTAIFSWGFITITTNGILAGLSLCVRFAALVLLLTLSSATLSTLEIVHGLNVLFSPLNKLGINSGSAAMVVQIMLRFIPILALNAEKIAKSQASRGALWGNPKGSLVQKAKQLLPLLIPLFSVSLQQADSLAEAMLSRGYESHIKRTGLVQYSFGYAESIFILVIFAAAYVILFFPL